MELNKTDYKRLGDYIREVDVRNRDLKVTKLLGVSISKEFIPSIANTIGTDMSTYKIVAPNQFAYGPVTSRNGDKVSIALLSGNDMAIISQAYTVFEVIDDNRLLPEYLMMWFRRPEFDRYARFHSHGSAREIFDWDEMCDVILPIPPIERQREIVSEYETLSRRIELNNKMISRLEETAQTLYRKMFVDGIDKENLPDGWRMGTLGEYSPIKPGFAFKSEWWQNYGIPVIKIGSINNHIISKNDCDFVDHSKIILAKDSQAKYGDIVIAMTGATIGKIAINFNRNETFLVNQRVGLFNLGDNPINKAPFLYFKLQQDNIYNEILSIGGGSAQANISNKDIDKIEIILPDINTINNFNTVCKLLFDILSIKWNEINILNEIQYLLLSKIR